MPRLARRIAAACLASRIPDPAGRARSASWLRELAGAAACVAMLAPPIGLAADDQAVVNVYNWADYIGEHTIENFEAEFGIEVNYDIYDSSEIVDAKLMAGSTGYDVVVHSAQFSSRLIPVGLFQPLDRRLLPNWKHMDPAILSILEDYNDPGNAYAVPYMWGTTGFSYNVDMIRARMPDAPLGSADMIFDPEVVSRFADCGVSFLDSPTDVLPMALTYLGYDENSTDPRALADVEAMLKSVRPYIRYFSSTKMLMDLPNKEICIAMSWSGDYATAQWRAEQAGVAIDIRYTVPAEGAGAWFDAFFIPVDAPHPRNAHLFIDYMLRPEVIAETQNFTRYASANLAATPLVDPRIVADPAIYPTEEVMKRLYPVVALPPKAERLRTRIWARVKLGL